MIRQGGLATKANFALTYRNTAVDNQRKEKMGAVRDQPACEPLTGDGTDIDNGCVEFENGATKEESKASSTDLEGAPDMKVCACYPANCLATDGGPAFTNEGSLTRGNVGAMDPGTIGGLNNQYDIPGDKDHNFNLELAENYLGSPQRERRAPQGA